MNNFFEFIKRNFIIFLSGMTIIPLLILSFFAHPAAGDDYFYSNSVIQNGFWEAQKMMYWGWQGRFFATALASVNPLVFGWIFGYKLVPIILIFLLLHSFYVLISEVTKRSLPLKTTLTLTAALFFLYVFNMPSLCEGIYWMVGTLTYQAPNIFTVYFFALLIRVYRTAEISKRRILVFISAGLLIAAIGSNETIMFILLVSLSSIFVYRFLMSRKIDALLGLLLGIAIIASCVVIFAPGNTARASHTPHQPDLIKALSVSTMGSVTMMAEWLGSPILLLTMMFIPLGLQISNKLKKDENPFAIHPLISTCMLLIVTGSTFFPAAWARGNLGPLRVLNVGYLVFLLGWFFNIEVIIHYFNKSAFKLDKLFGYVYPILGVAVFCSLFMQHNNIRLAYSNLLPPKMIKGIISLEPRKSDLRGTAYAYDMKMWKRYKALQQCQGDICEVKKFKSHPYAIFFEDIEENEKDWRNMTVASYFNKKGIKFKKDFKALPEKNKRVY